MSTTAATHVSFTVDRDTDIHSFVRKDTDEDQASVLLCMDNMYLHFSRFGYTDAEAIASIDRLIDALVDLREEAKRVTAEQRVAA